MEWRRYYKDYQTFDLALSFAITFMENCKVLLDRIITQFKSKEDLINFFLVKQEPIEQLYCKMKKRKLEEIDLNEIRAFFNCVDFIVKMHSSVRSGLKILEVCDSAHQIFFHCFILYKLEQLDSMKIDHDEIYSRYEAPKRLPNGSTVGDLVDAMNWEALNEVARKIDELESEKNFQHEHFDSRWALKNYYTKKVFEKINNVKF
jgi:hypothetical protein